MGKRKRPEGGGGRGGNGYAGYAPERDGEEVERVDAAGLGWAAFWERHVRPRKPCVLLGLLEAAEEWRGLRRWTVPYLARQAGGAEVRVEVRATAAGAYGEGRHRRMRFGDFLAEVEGGNERLYVTTQAAAADRRGQPAVLGPPLLSLAGDFPARPAILAGLVPAAANLWMGHAPAGAGTSSGLHHDFHDNLYALLRGRKRFVLVSPGEAGRMGTAGRVARVHANGLINYEGHEATRADGFTEGMRAIAAEDRQRRAERRVAAAERAVERGEPGAERRLQEAGEELELALDALLDGGDDGGWDEEGEAAEEEEEEEEEEAAAAGTPPPHFCKESFFRGAAERPPNLRGVDRMTCTVEAGEVLYLPASWFHEVQSESVGGGGHLALNMWFHPPDGKSACDRPYTDPFWETNWEERTAAGTAGTSA